MLPQMKIIEKKQIVLLYKDMLNYIDEFCKKNSIKYYLTAGTLLGSVRHKGFIPWDDDVDICMLRRDFEKFVELFKDTKEYELQCLSKTKDYKYPYGKIRDKRTQKYNMSDGNAVFPEEGLEIDIFIVDGYSNIEFIRNIHFKIQLWLFRDVYSRVLFWDNLGTNTWKSKLKNLIRRIVTPNRAAKMVYFHAGIWDAYKTKYAGTMVGLYRAKMEIAHSDSFLNSTNGEFEGEYYPIPAGYDEVLKSIYDENYMTPPPVDKRASTHSTYIGWIID